MGAAWSWLSSFMVEQKFVAVLGLDSSGKTALVHRLMYGELVDTYPTMGFHIHEVRISNTYVHMADVCGQDSIRNLWSNFYHSADGVIFIIDGEDRERLPIAMDELRKVMRYPGSHEKPFLILSNKQDSCVNAIDVSEIKHEIKHTIWRAFNVSVKSGEGVHESMEWFVANI